MSSSRLLSRLDAAIAAADDPVTADCLRAERASYMARQGQFDEARAVLTELHERYDARPVDAISAWLNFSEALASHFESMSPDAWDRMRRANALSTAFRIQPMKALSAAWLAYFAFVRVDVDGMIRYLKEAIACGDAMTLSAKARTSLVIAQSYHIAGNYAAATPWYGQTRNYASQDGDELMTSSLLHNMAWVRAANLRQTRLAGTGPVDGLDHVLLSAESVMHFDNVIGLSSLSALVPMLRAQVLALCGRAQEALALYDGALGAAQTQGQSRLSSWILSDRAWCKAILGNSTSAAEDAQAAFASIDEKTHVDDRAATYSRLTQTYECLGDDASAAKFRLLAEADWAVYGDYQRKLLTALNEAAFVPPDFGPQVASGSAGT